MAETKDPCFYDTVIPTAPPDAVFITKTQYQRDSDPRKVNLGIGAYRDENGNPYVLPCVLQASKEVLDEISKAKSNFEYLDILGYSPFYNEARKLIFGIDSEVNQRTASIQSLSGTGGLRVAAIFIKKFFSNRELYVPDPTWVNHLAVAREAGITPKRYYYYDPKKRGFDLELILKCIREAPIGSIFLFHACANNPTGIDPTPEEWEKMADLLKEKKIFIWLDMAYQGFASGDLDKDSYSARMFARRGFEMILCQSFSKSLGLYNARVGALHFVCHDSTCVAPLMSQLAIIARPMYSNPPAFGAYVAYKEQWNKELIAMAGTIIERRKALRSEMERLGTPGDWSFITTQIGMFTWTGLKAEQCDVLINKHHIHLLRTGRISIAGLYLKNIPYVAQALNDVVRNYP